MPTLTAEQRRLFFSLTDDQRRELEQAATAISEIEAKFNDAYNRCQALSRQYEALTGQSLLAIISGSSSSSQRAAAPASAGNGKRMRFEDYVDGLHKSMQKGETFTVSELATALEQAGYHPSKNSLMQAIVPRMVEDGVIVDTGDTQGRARLYRRA